MGHDPANCICQIDAICVTWVGAVMTFIDEAQFDGHTYACIHLQKVATMHSRESSEVSRVPSRGTKNVEDKI